MSQAPCVMFAESEDGRDVCQYCGWPESAHDIAALVLQSDADLRAKVQMLLKLVDRSRQATNEILEANQKHKSAHAHWCRVVTLDDLRKSPEYQALKAAIEAPHVEGR